MSNPRRLLLLEDNDDDAALTERELRREGLDFTLRRVETERDFRQELHAFAPDLILADYSLPTYDGLSALALVRRERPDVPFLFVSGTIGEEVAIEALKHGATDYVLKQRLGRLVPSVQRALREAAEQAGRQAAELALRESEQHFRALVESTQDWVWEIDADGVYTYSGPQVSTLLGYTPAEILGRTPFDLMPPSEAARVAALMMPLIAARQPIRGVENVNRHKDGHLVVMETNGVPCFDDDGIFLGYRGIDRDISARKQAEAALAETRLHLRAFFDFSPALNYIKDLDGHYLMVNRLFREKYGILAENTGHLTSNDIFPPEVAAARRERDDAVIAGGLPVVSEEINAEPDGAHVYLAVRFPLRDAAGQTTALGVVATDITERKQAEDRLREQTQLLDRANDAIYTRTLDGLITFWNEGAERLYGWTRNEVLGRRLTELNLQEMDAAAEASGTLLQHGGWTGERTHLTKSGTEVTVFLRLTVVKNEHGEPASVFAINTDITETKQFEARFLQAQRLESLGALAGGIAHDLNNVLAPILMATDILKQRAQSEMERRMFDTMQTAARRGAHIIRQVLTFARGVKGERTPVQIRHLLREMADIAQEIFPKSVQFELDSSRDLWPVLGDATQLHQVLMNLCVNARDAMPQGGTLTLTATNIELDDAFVQMTPLAKVGPYVRIGVADTGMGIARENFDKIFEPFFTTKDLGQGTGLGLATVLGIVKSHGGFLQFKSAPGQGTCFEAYLPAAPHELAVDAVAEAPPPRGHGELILVVDDEISIRTVAARVLEQGGYRTVEAADGSEALAVFMENRAEVAIVVTDMLMPGMDGPTFVGVLRHLDRKVRIIGMSGVGEKAEHPTLDAATMVGFLQKPFTADHLLSLIGQALQVPASPTGSNPPRPRPQGGSGSPHGTR